MKNLPDAHEEAARIMTYIMLTLGETWPSSKWPRFDVWKEAGLVNKTEKISCSSYGGWDLVWGRENTPPLITTTPRGVSSITKEGMKYIKTGGKING